MPMPDAQNVMPGAAAQGGNLPPEFLAALNDWLMASGAADQRGGSASDAPVRTNAVPPSPPPSWQSPVMPPGMGPQVPVSRDPSAVNTGYADLMRSSGVMAQPPITNDASENRFAQFAFDPNSSANPAVTMPRQPAYTTTPVYTLGGKRMEARQPIPHSEKTGQEMLVESLPEIAGMVGGPVMRGGAAFARGALSAPKTAGAAATLLGLTTGSTEAAGPEKIDAAMKQIIASDPVLRSLQQQLDEQQRISTSSGMRKSDRERASSAAGELRTQFNARLTEMSKGSLPWDKAHSEWATAWPAVQWAAPIAAAWLTRNTGNVMHQLMTRPWRKAVNKAEEAMLGKVDDAFAYQTGKAVRHLENEPGRFGKSMRHAGEAIRETAAPVAAGTAVGMETALFPYQYNRANAPIGSQEREEAVKALKPENFWDTAWTGAGPGFFGGLTGAHLLPTIPRGYRPVAETQNLRDVLARRQPTAGPQPMPGGQGGPAGAGASASQLPVHAGFAASPLPPAATSPISSTGAGAAMAPVSSQSPVVAAAANQPSASNVLAPRVRKPSTEQYTASRDAVYDQLRGGTAPKNLSVAQARKAVESSGTKPPSDSVIQRHIREVREIAATTGAKGANLIRAIEARIRRGDYKNVLIPFIAGGAEAARRSAESDEATLY